MCYPVCSLMRGRYIQCAVLTRSLHLTLDPTFPSAGKWGSHCLPHKGLQALGLVYTMHLLAARRCDSPVARSWAVSLLLVGTSADKIFPLPGAAFALSAGELFTPALCMAKLVSFGGSASERQTLGCSIASVGKSPCF